MRKALVDSGAFSTLRYGFIAAFIETGLDPMQECGGTGLILGSAILCHAYRLFCEGSPVSGEMIGYRALLVSMLRHGARPDYTCSFGFYRHSVDAGYHSYHIRRIATSGLMHNEAGCLDDNVVNPDDFLLGRHSDMFEIFELTAAELVRCFFSED
jgi:hypothetical protein